jgi:hypothetical protein
MTLPTRVRSSLEANAIMQSELRPLAGRSMPLTSIVTQMPIDWVAQKEMAIQSLRNENTETANYDLLQVRMQVYRSMMQGTRGWIFRSGSSLDSGDITSVARSQGYAGVNQEIELLMPWIRASQSSWRSIPVTSKDYVASLIDTPNSQLLIAIASGPQDQICSVAPNVDRIQFTLPQSGQNRNVFRITHGEMELIRPQETASGLLITIPQPALIEQIVSVVDPKPVAYLREQLNRVAPGMVDSRNEITQQVLQIAQKTLVAQRVPTNDPRWEDVRRAQSMVRDSIQYLERSNLPKSLKSADDAMKTAQRVVRKAWEEGVSQFSAFQSSPLIASPLSLPLHFEFSRLLQGRSWQSISVPGVPFATTESFLDSGWQVDRRLTETVQTNCVVGRLGPEGAPTLMLSAAPIRNQPIPTGYAGAAMRVSSKPLQAPVGSMVYIQGLVRIDSLADESQSGLLVCDSAGGETLGQLISSSEKSEYEWRRFELIRFVSQPEGIRIHFETRGQVQALIADLRAEMIMPTQVPGMETRPIESVDLISIQSSKELGDSP